MEEEEGHVEVDSVTESSDGVNFNNLFPVKVHGARDFTTSFVYFSCCIHHGLIHSFLELVQFYTDR